MGGHPLGHRNHAAIDHQHPVVAAPVEAFDNHAPRDLFGGFVGFFCRLKGVDIDGDAAPVIAVEGLDDDGVAAHILDRILKLIEIVDHGAPRHGYPGVAQNLLGTLFVGGQLYG